MICAGCGQMFPNKLARKGKAHKPKEEKYEKGSLMEKVMDLVEKMDNKVFWKKKTFERFTFNSKKHNIDFVELNKPPITKGKDRLLYFFP